MGRYVTQDPIGLIGGTNQFRYSNNQPIGFFDPLGLNSTASKNGLDVVIKADVSLRGPHANAELAKKWQDAINNTWNGSGRKYKNCNVKIKVNVSVMNESAENQVIVGKPGINGRSYVNKVGGNGGIWYADDAPWVSAHEMGHVMGLGDRYKDNAKGISVPNKGWENNIMGAYGGIVEQKNIDELIGENLNLWDRLMCVCGF